MPALSASVLALACALALGACSMPRGVAAESKMDAPLRARLATASGSPISCLIELAPSAPADAREELEDVGLAVTAVAGSVVTATGSSDAVGRAAQFRWVRSLELSQDRPPLPSSRDIP